MTGELGRADTITGHSWPPFRKRGTCPDCGRVVALRRGGLMWWHCPKIGTRRGRWGGMHALIDPTRWCTGEGKRCLEGTMT